MKKCLLLPLLLLLLSHRSAAQTAAFDTASFTFIATFVLPRNGPSAQLYGVDYDLRVTADSLVSYLPYRGRAQVAPVHPERVGIRISTTAFTKRTRLRRNGWQVTLEPRNQPDAYRMELTVSKDGSAALQVYSNRRDIVGFHGYIAGMQGDGSEN